MATISGPTLLGGTILESPLRRWLPHLSLVDHSCGGPSARSGSSLLIRSMLGSRWGGLSAPLYLALGVCVCVVCGGGVSLHRGACGPLLYI